MASFSGRRLKSFYTSKKVLVYTPHPLHPQKSAVWDMRESVIIYEIDVAIFKHCLLQKTQPCIYMFYIKNKTELASIL